MAWGLTAGLHQSTACTGPISGVMDRFEGDRHCERCRIGYQRSVQDVARRKVSISGVRTLALMYVLCFPAGAFQPSFPW